MPSMFAGTILLSEFLQIYFTKVSLFARSAEKQGRNWVCWHWQGFTGKQLYLYSQQRLLTTTKESIMANSKHIQKWKDAEEAILHHIVQSSMQQCGSCYAHDGFRLLKNAGAPVFKLLNKTKGLHLPLRKSSLSSGFEDSAAQSILMNEQSHIEALSKNNLQQNICYGLRLCLFIFSTRQSKNSFSLKQKISQSC